MLKKGMWVILKNGKIQISLEENEIQPQPHHTVITSMNVPFPSGFFLSMYIKTCLSLLTVFHRKLIGTIFNGNYNWSL